MVDSLAKIEYLQKYMADLDTSSYNALRYLFKTCLRSKKKQRQHEKELTGAFADSLTKNLAAVKLKCRTEVPVDAKVDMLLNSELDKREPVLLFQFGWGCKNDHWWTKADQTLMYLDQMAKNQLRNNYACFGNKPMLLVVITIDRNTHERFMLGQIAVFLCWHNSLNDLNMSLLWRRQTMNVTQMSNAMAFTIIAGQHLDRWCNSGRADFPCVDRNCAGFEYLGPNCCRVLYNTGQDMVRYLIQPGQLVARY